VGLKLRPLAYILALANLLIYRVEIALETEIGPGLEIPHGNCVIGAYRIGSNFTIFQGCTIGSHSGNLDDPQKPIGDDRPIIGDNVVMYANSIVVGPITIGSKCVIGANTFVAESLDNETIVKAAPPVKRTIR
jgi:serine O-acetyltransferase